MNKKEKKTRKIYRTNPDTISLNCKQFKGRSLFFPGPEPWERPFDPRRELGETEKALRCDASRRRKKRKKIRNR